MLLSSLAHAAATVTLCIAPSPIPDIFVDVNRAGCMSGTGTSIDPVCSIGAAIALASAGDTIRIAAGTYVENVVVGFDLNFIGTGGSSVVLVDGGDAGSVVTIPAAVTA